MFSQACVIPSVHGGRGYLSQHAMGQGSVVDTPTQADTPALLHPPPSRMGCYGIRSTSGRYASYFNAFLWYVLILYSGRDFAFLSNYFFLRKKIISLFLTFTEIMSLFFEINVPQPLCFSQSK